MRVATIERTTGETSVSLRLALDGSGQADISTGVGFLDHMLELLAKHGLFDLTVKAEGDTHVDDHHTVEDVGICLGQAIAKAVGDKAGISRYGHWLLPMDETLVAVACDLSGRACYVGPLDFRTAKIGAFDVELVEHFWESVAQQAAMNLHIEPRRIGNSHHLAEAVFKGCARALRVAVAIDPRQQGIPSSKGTLGGSAASD